MKKNILFILAFACLSQSIFAMKTTSPNMKKKQYEKNTRKRLARSPGGSLLKIVKQKNLVAYKDTNPNNAPTFTLCFELKPENYLNIVKERLKKTIITPETENHLGKPLIFSALLHADHKKGKAFNDMELLEVLLLYCKNKNPLYKGLTCLTYAIAIPYKQIRLISLKTLLEHGINPNQKDSHGNLALHQAVEKQCIESVKILLNNNAEPSIRNSKNQTAYDIAARKKGENASPIANLLQEKKRKK